MDHVNLLIRAILTYNTIDKIHIGSMYKFSCCHYNQYKIGVYLHVGCRLTTV